MVTMKFKLLFFDSAAVIRAVDAASRKALSKAGAFIRQRAKSSIRKRRGVSRPGQAPSSHAGHLKRLLFFAWDPAAETVVIGPARFGAGEAPNLLEFGGTIVRKGDRSGKPRRLRYRARPFMGPAYEKEKAQLPKRWQRSIRG